MKGGGGGGCLVVRGTKLRGSAGLGGSDGGTDVVYSSIVVVL